MDSDGFQYSSSEYVALSGVKPAINSTRIPGTEPALGVPVATVAPQFPPQMPSPQVPVMLGKGGSGRSNYRAGYRAKYTIPQYLQQEATNYEMYKARAGYNSPGAVARSTQAMDMGSGYVPVSRT